MKLRLYVYPGLDPSSGRRLTLENFEAPKSVASLFGYLVEKGLVRSLEGLPDDQLRLTSDEILARLRSGDLSWEAFVEPEVVFAIKAGGLFGYGAARR
jgi:hypothetical protein